MENPCSNIPWTDNQRLKILCKSPKNRNAYTDRTTAAGSLLRQCELAFASKCWHCRASLSNSPSQPLPSTSPRDQYNLQHLNLLPLSRRLLPLPLLASLEYLRSHLHYNLSTHTPLLHSTQHCTLNSLAKCKFMSILCIFFLLNHISLSRIFTEMESLNFLLLLC